uniref:Uncharacterized protein n=1 Tax=Rhizophora mucronata TaxID=61149 RepID=A0A2P2J0M0_RHIMU
MIDIPKTIPIYFMTISSVAPVSINTSSCLEAATPHIYVSIYLLAFQLTSYLLQTYKTKRTRRSQSLFSSF